MALLLGIEEGFCGAFEFDEKSVLVLFVVPNIWLKILGMFILPMLQLSAGLFLLYVYLPWLLWELAFCPCL